MESTKSPEHLLNEILEYLNKSATAEDMQTIIDNNLHGETVGNLRAKEINQIVAQLIEDKYVLVWDRNPAIAKNQLTYFLGFKGKYFLKRGGYIMDAQNKALALEKQSADLKAVKRSNTVLAIATAILALDPILKFLHWISHFCH